MNTEETIAMAIEHGGELLDDHENADRRMLSFYPPELNAFARAIADRALRHPAPAQVAGDAGCPSCAGNRTKCLMTAGCNKHVKLYFSDGAKANGKSQFLSGSPREGFDPLVKLADAQAALAVQAAAIARLTADLTDAATTLRRYETLHRAKGTAKSTAKAEANAALAARFEATIAKGSGK